MEEITETLGLDRHRKQDTYTHSPNSELMAEDVGVAIGIGLETSHIRHSVGRHCPTLDSTKILRAAYAPIMVCPRKRAGTA